MGLDRISLKPIPSSWSGKDLAGTGDDGKLFVVKLISLLAPTAGQPTCPPIPWWLGWDHLVNCLQSPPAAQLPDLGLENSIIISRAQRAVSDSHTDQIREMPSDNTTLRLGIPLPSQPAPRSV